MPGEAKMKNLARFAVFALAAAAVFRNTTTPALNLVNLYDVGEETNPTKSTVTIATAPFTEEAVQQQSRSTTTNEFFQQQQQHEHNDVTRKEQRGSWIGNNWVPPHGWGYYSATELKDFYRGTSVLWIGDSTARRAATTMYGILNNTNSSSSNSSQHDVSVDEIDHPSVIDVNKGSVITEPCNSRWINDLHHPDFCRDMPGGGGGSFIYVPKLCLKDLELFVSDELSGKSNITADIDITIIISLGIWEVMKAWACNETTSNNVNHPSRSVEARQNDTIALLEKLQSTRRSVVWRTSGYIASGNNEDLIFDMNEKAMDQIEEIITSSSGATTKTNNLTFVDWGGAIRPRSFGNERISGDMRAHYGVEARYVLVQMISNQLASRGVRRAQLETRIESTVARLYSNSTT
jgi:hypothetical protein